MNVLLELKTRSIKSLVVHPPTGWAIDSQTKWRTQQVHSPSAAISILVPPPSTTTVIFVTSHVPE
jgi:hypothetical protein